MPNTPVLLPAVSFRPSNPFVLGPTDLGNRYQGISLIAEGGMGAVYRGHQIRADYPSVALKLLTDHSGAMIERFEREIAAVTRLSHPNIVKTLDHGRDERFGPFIVMELLKGETLEDFLNVQPHARLSAEKTAEIALPVCGALLYAHSLRPPLMHRDVKPANVFLCNEEGPEGPKVKVMDLGLARDPDAVFGGRGSHQKITEAGIALGTLEYISPEQCRSRPGLSSDIYSLGIMLYQMIEGRLPFPPDLKKAEDLVLWHLDGKPHPMNFGPPIVRDLIGGMMDKEPKRRPPLREVQNVLSRLVSSDRPRAMAMDSVRPLGPTLVGIPIMTPPAHEIMTARMTTSSDMTVTVRGNRPQAKTEGMAIPEAIDDQAYLPAPLTPSKPHRRRIANPMGIMIIGTQVLEVQAPPAKPRPRRFFGASILGWLYRRVARIFSSTEG